MSIKVNPKEFIIPRSFSTALMDVTNGIRNKDGILNKVVAEGIYPMITTISLIETVVMSIFTALSLFTLPFTSECFNYCFEELKSSSFAIIWSVFNIFINPFCSKVAVYEMQAREIASRLFSL
jgi:hypothetical protein